MGIYFEGGGHLLPYSAGVKNGRINPQSLYTLCRGGKNIQKYLLLFLRNCPPVYILQRHRHTPSILHTTEILENGTNADCFLLRLSMTYLVALLHCMTLHCVTRRLSHFLLPYASCNIRVQVVVVVIVIIIVIVVVVTHEYQCRVTYRFFCGDVH